MSSFMRRVTVKLSEDVYTHGRNSSCFDVCRLVVDVVSATTLPPLLQLSTADRQVQQQRDLRALQKEPFLSGQRGSDPAWNSDVPVLRPDLYQSLRVRGGSVFVHVVALSSMNADVKENRFLSVPRALSFNILNTDKSLVEYLIDWLLLTSCLAPTELRAIINNLLSITVAMAILLLGKVQRHSMYKMKLYIYVTLHRVMIRVFTLNLIKSEFCIGLTLNHMINCANELAMLTFFPPLLFGAKHAPQKTVLNLDCKKKKKSSWGNHHTA